MTTSGQYRRDITPDTELGWEGMARMAERVRDAGVPLTDLQREALRRYLNPRSSFQSLTDEEWAAYRRIRAQQESEAATRSAARKTHMQEDTDFNR